MGDLSQFHTNFTGQFITLYSILDFDAWAAAESRIMLHVVAAAYAGFFRGGGGLTFLTF